MQLLRTIPATVGQRANWPGNISRQIAFSHRCWPIAVCEAAARRLTGRQADVEMPGTRGKRQSHQVTSLTRDGSRDAKGVFEKAFTNPFPLNLERDDPPRTGAWPF